MNKNEIKERVKHLVYGVPMLLAMMTIIGSAGSLYAQSVSGTINGHNYVDLGLPSGVKWATCNVGTDAPEQYDEYFQWGAVTTPTGNDYTKESCKTYKLNISDIKRSSLDVAHVKWGDPWRMPTVAEFDELLDSENCEWLWTTQNGVVGYKVISKSNGNSIFLPANGSRNGKLVRGAGEYGSYWSSTPYESLDGAYALIMYGKAGVDTGWFNRFSGSAVRPVTLSAFTFRPLGSGGSYDESSQDKKPKEKNNNNSGDDGFEINVLYKAEGACFCGEDGKWHDIQGSGFGILVGRLKLTGQLVWEGLYTSPSGENRRLFSVYAMDFDIVDNRLIRFYGYFFDDDDCEHKVTMILDKDKKLFTYSEDGAKYNIGMAGIHEIEYNPDK